MTLCANETCATDITTVEIFADTTRFIITYFAYHLVIYFVTKTET